MNIEDQIIYQDTKKMYLKSIRKTALKVCLILFLMNFLAMVFVFATSVVLNVFKLNLSSQMLKYLQAYLPCIVSEIVLIPIGFLLLRKEIDISYFKIFGNKPQTHQQMPDIQRFSVLSILGVFGITFVVTRILSILILCLDGLGYTLKMPDLDFSGDIVVKTLAILYTCIMAPILEEIIIRGFVLNSFKKYGNMTAIIVSSIAFAMIHMNPVQIPVGFLTGLLLGFVTIKTGNIGLAIIIHIANNTLNGLPAEILGDQNFFVIGFSFLLMLVGVGILARFIYLYGRDFTQLYRDESRTYATVGKKLLHTILTITSILFILEWLVNNIFFILECVVKK